MTPREEDLVEYHEAKIIRQLLRELKRKGFEIDHRRGENGEMHYRAKNASGTVMHHFIDRSESRASESRRIEMRPQEWTRFDVESEGNIPDKETYDMLTSPEIEKKPKN